jgi:endoglucanase
MRNFGFFDKRTVLVCALLAVPTAVACSDAPEGTSQESLPTETTMGAELPPDQTSDDANPQRHPELWTRPASIPEAAPPDPAAETPAPLVIAAPTLPAAVAVPFRGVNLAGGEFGSALPGADGKDYTFPTRSDVDYYLAKGMNTFRIGFKWERMQRSAYGAFDATYLARLDSVVAYATSKGARVILNPHNFARYYGSTVGSAAVPNGVFADFWKKVATKYAANDKVMFNLVNEPHDMVTEQWVGAANAAIAAIRGVGASNVIIVPGNAWTGAHSWYSSGYGTPNATAMLKVSDPKNNVLFEVHQYMDSDSSGGSGTCISTTIGKERLMGFVKWLRDNKKKGFLGEFAGGNNATCNTAVRTMLDYVHASSDVLVGWTWWAGGPWWGEYVFTLNPIAGRDRPQMAILAPFLKK